MIQISAGILIALAGVYIFLKNVKISELWGQIAATKIWVIAGVALLNPVTLWFRALRWKIILPSRSSVNKRGLFPVVVIGFMVNNILPARLGEAARAILLWKRHKFTITESVGSLILERCIDSLVFLSFLFLPIFFKQGLEHLSLYGFGLLAIFTTIVTCIAMYAFFPLLTKKISRNCVSILPEKIETKVLKLGKELLSNLDWIFSWQKVVSVLVLSYITIFVQAGMMWLLGFDLESFGLLDSMFGVAFAALGAAIPLSPGYVGTLHATLMQGLVLAGVSSEKAGAIAILYHAIGYIVVTVLGVWFFFAAKMTFKEIGKAREVLNQ